MARCAYCKSETGFFDRGLPVCSDCASLLETKPQPSSTEDSLTRLQRELRAATARAHLATDAFHAIMGDIPSSVPQPDGTQRINNVYRELSFARREMMRAHSRLAHFLDTGEVRDEDLE